MASSGAAVIDIQPQTGTLSSLEQPDVDPTSERIVFEGTCCSEALKHDVKQYWTIIGIVVPLMMLPMLLPCLLFGIWFGNYRAKQACRTWKLYLTRKHIIYNRSSICGVHTLRIALTDIRAIQLQTGALISVGCCGAGQMFASPTAMDIEVEPDYRNRYPHVFQIYYCKNAADFVQAVKEQMEV